MLKPKCSSLQSRPWRRLTALASTMILLTACQVGGNSPEGSTSGGETGGLKLGSLLPSTGDLAPLGVPMISTVPMLVETVNACGGVNDKPIELTAADDETDPTKGSLAMTNLVEVKKVAAVVGSFASSVSQAAVDVGKRNKVMLVSPGSTSTEFTGRAKKGDFKNGETQYWARTAPPDTYQARALAKLAKEKGFQKVSTVVINNDYGVSFEREFVQAFKKLGGTVINEAKPTRYDPKGTTFDSEAAAAFANKPQAVIAVLYAETGALLLKSAYEQGLTTGVQVMLTDGVKSDEFASQVGKTSDGKFIIEGALGTVPGADGSALAALTKLWKSKNNNQSPPAYVPQTWDAGALLVLSAQAAKSNSGDAIANKIRDVANSPGQEVTDVCEGLKLLKEDKEINYQGASGNVDIDENGDVLGIYDVWTVKSDGKLNVIGQVEPSE
ncbi:MAG: ABC transporter substrate-binding protein [Acaryochloridaceae cyanobacterium SU_2_1]|nr:ABC transporter substrate-binding protein [Acaryochloridaceae cyanobacterium SU_2_1]